MAEFSIAFFSLHTAKLGYKHLSAFFRADLDRKRQIWPAALSGLDLYYGLFVSQ